MRIIFYLIFIILLVRFFYDFFNNSNRIEEYFSNAYHQEKLNIYFISVKDEKYSLDVETILEKDKYIKIPYDIPFGKIINLDAYESELILNYEHSKNHEKNAKLKLSYPEQIGLTGKGFIVAKLELDDKNSNVPDNNLF